MFQSVFFRRLFLPYLALICIAIAGVGAFAGIRLRSTYLEARRQGLKNELHLMVESLQGELEQGRLDEVDRHIRALGQQLNARVTVIREDGLVVADNWADPARMENHADRLEVREAMRSREAYDTRHSDTTGQDMLYLARYVSLPGQGYVLRLAVPAGEIRKQLRVLYAGLAGAAVIAMAGATLIAFHFARRHSKPIVELTQVARAISHGDLKRRSLSRDKGEIGELTGALNSMADSIGRLLAQAEQGKAELLTILSSMSEGVIATDEQQIIRLVNDSAGQLLGFDADHALRKPFWQVVRNDRIIKAADQVMGGQPSQVLEAGPIEGRHVEVRLSRYRSETQASGLVVVAYDTTHLVRYQELRKEFVANVSHELRTPLSVIRGFVETLADGALNDPVKAPEYLAAIQRHTEQLTNLVNDLLALSRLESQPELPRRVNVDLAASARRAVELLMPAARRKRQELAVDVASVPAIIGDPDYIERAIVNLIDNAIKYTPENGRIAVCVKNEPAGILVQVDDNGIGIPEADLPRIFERFYRVDRSRSREMGGTGLGLAIVKHIMQVHGGTVAVQSTPSKGSIFRLRFPVPASD